MAKSPKAPAKAPRDWTRVLRRLDDVRWELPADALPGMRVPGRIYANEKLIELIATDEAVGQVAGVATLPGIVGASLAMPDIHQGYGFPIGGVAATRVSDGVVSPGGVGFDINCGVRLLRSSLFRHELQPRLGELLDQLARDVPAGAGTGTKAISADDQEGVLWEGAARAVAMGHGCMADLAMLESGGALPDPEPALVSERARKRGLPQLGTLGSGNHFLEVQAVDRIFDEAAAAAYGFEGRGQIVVMLHTGSRGLGHQVCQDFLGLMQGAMQRYGINVPDAQLACVPVRSQEGREYLGAMSAAANFAWANRQAITGAVRRAFARVLGVRDPDAELPVVYDVSHNIVKIERHTVDGEALELCVHRKGATRAFPAGHPEVPQPYRGVGQPVLVPGDMGRYSYVCAGLPGAMAETFGSCCHGAGRVLSRSAAKRSLAGVDIAKRMQGEGVLVRAANRADLAAEASEAYKDAREVVLTVQEAGIARMVAQLRPLGVVKG
ncbi:MAG TPA: RtcB family protein [Dehalococcoidia bacterium]|nr:RtcB family protein [Dehalococcoidia bacterium]